MILHCASPYRLLGTYRFWNASAIHKNIFCCPMVLESMIGRFCTSIETSPANLYKLIENKLSSDDFSQTFASKQSLREAYTEIKKCEKDLHELRSLIDNPHTEQDMLDLATQEIESLNQAMMGFTEKVKELIIPDPQYDAENAIIEVVPGAGGLEANMFAEEIFLMYVKYVTELGFTMEGLDVAKSVVGKQSKFSSSTGITKGVVTVSGVDVFGQLKYESGVHRVQRVPVTGSKADRLHTSTCSVAILPKLRHINIELRDSELKYDFMRAKGAGGQGVNTTDSACRITHLPTGISVESQEERSQIQNKKNAYIKLKNILYQQKFIAMMSKEGKSRKEQIGNMDRNEKIRTYNFNRNMVTDHRLGQSKTVPNIVAFLSGDYGFSLLHQFYQSLELKRRDEIFEEMLKTS